jgi:hypothetical protein
MKSSMKNRIKTHPHNIKKLKNPKKAPQQGAKKAFLFQSANCRCTQLK